MKVYAEREELVRAAEALDKALHAPDEMERLIRFGQFEAGVADAVCPEVDEETALTSALRRIALSGRYEDALSLELPEWIRIRPAEGFAWYALYPRQYEAAARRFVAQSTASNCVVIGIRSIGTTLSTLVQRITGGESFTVRPRGHPFDRGVRLGPALEGMVRRCEWALVVDEGPGISGSSFAGVAEAVSALGVPDDRIVFFPAYEPDVQNLASVRARNRWPKHHQYVECFRPEYHVPTGSMDLSGGKWREFLGCEDVAVVPAHERLKYLDPHAGVLWKWAGLGQYGRQKLARAEALDDFIPPALELHDGFLLSRWVTGKPARRADEALLDTMARYLAFLAAEFDTGEPADYDSLCEMIRENTGAEAQRPEEFASKIAVDGRMLPHEWIETAEGWLKADALDHHDDHFYPGCQDIAWDIAGAAVEFGFDARLLAERYLQYRRDRTLLLRLPFYRQAYAAYRFGYASMFGLEELKRRYLDDSTVSRGK